MISAWQQWQIPSDQSGFSEGESGKSLITFLGSCDDVAAMKALMARFASLPLTLKIEAIRVATGSDTAWESLRERGAKASPEVAALAEELAVTALDDLATQYGTSGSRGTISYSDPRVCDEAAFALASHWPERFRFRWAPTRLERDEEIAIIRNTWLLAHGKDAVPLPQRPTHARARFEPNVLAAIEWKNGPPLEKLPLSVGEKITSDALVDTFLQLHRDLPADCRGFTFTAERPGDGKGFVVHVQWHPGKRPDPIKWWEHNVNISLGGSSLYNTGGGSAAEYRLERSNHREELDAAGKALAADPQQGVVITYHTKAKSD